MTEHEAIAKVMLLRDYIRNEETNKLKDISNDEYLEYMAALSMLINIATEHVKNAKAKPEKTGLELFAEVLAERSNKQ